MIIYTRRLANRITVNDDEVLGYVIDGIPDPNLRDLARVRGFTTMDEILQAFEKITLRDKSRAGVIVKSDEKKQRYKAWK